jgi:hypothetical protein
MSGQDIKQRSTFYGMLPPGSTKPHLAVVLNVKGALVKCCYFTSVLNLDVLRYTQAECIAVKKEDMIDYFPNTNRDSYIFISERSIFDMLDVTLKAAIETGEFEERPPLKEELFSDIVEMIRHTENLPEKFKKELLDFINGWHKL